jgi:sugar (pentulose or hexulose) kinase
MSELVGNVAATAARVAGGVASKGLFSALLGAAPWLPVAIMVVGLAGTLAGAGTAVWYRMKWLDEVAAGKQALIDQREIDRRDNSLAIGNLTNQLNKNERSYEDAMQRLQRIPKGTNPERDKRIDAARDILCSKYPASEACSGPRPTR